MGVRLLIRIGAVATCTLSTSAAMAAVGLTTATINMRTGPAPAYPPVRVIPAGHRVTVFGCLASYHWCDVRWGPYRGWVYAAHLVHAGPRPAAPIPRRALSIGIPVVTYDLVAYHKLYYRGRPNYLVAPGIAVRRAARIEYRVQRRMHRRWRRWTE